MTLFFSHAGPMVKYNFDILDIHDLNPEAHLRWRMSRREMFMFGLRCVIASIRR
jgi:hypothetical protein